MEAALGNPTVNSSVNRRIARLERYAASGRASGWVRSALTHPSRCITYFDSV